MHAPIAIARRLRICTSQNEIDPYLTTTSHEVTMKYKAYA